MAALHVMEKLEQAGYQAYLVGGCVRDECLGKIPQDYDVTTDARPEQVMEIFEKVIPNRNPAWNGDGGGTESPG